MKEIIDCTTKELKEKAKKEFDETKNIKKTASLIDTKARNINWVKQFTSIDYFLLIAVLSLLSSVFLTLFESDKIVFYGSYFMFMIGMAFSSAIVLEWAVFSRIVRQYKFEEEKIIFNRLFH